MKRVFMMGIVCALSLQTMTAAQAEELKVVVLQSLTGAAAFIGTRVRDGMLLAVDEINANEELGSGRQLSVVVEDDATDRAQTLAIMSRHAANPEILAIVGPTSGAVAIAAANLANELQIPMLTTTNTVEALKAGPWSFIQNQPATITMPYLAGYATEVLGVQRCAMIGIRDVEAYVTIQNVLESLLREKGVTIVSNDNVAIADSDFTALATRVSGQEQDCLIVSAPAAQGANIIIQLKQAGLDPDVKILGHTAFASPVFVERGGPAVEGTVLIGEWLPGGFDDFSAAFAANFEARYGIPPDNWAAVGYGQMRVIAAALANAGANPTRQSVRDALTALRDVRVVVGQGRWSLDEERMPHFGMNVLIVQNGNFVPAPR